MSDDNSKNNDKQLFQEAMKGVTPLHKSNKTRSFRDKPKPSARVRTYIPKSQPIILSNPWEYDDITPDTCLSFGSQTIGSRQFKALQKGQIRPEARLDLHGYCVDKAAIELPNFIQRARAMNKRCVLIIHGKGSRYERHSTLKSHVNHWLKQLPEVLAYHSAQSRDGGGGAVFVLLKKK